MLPGNPPLQGAESTPEHVGGLSTSGHDQPSSISTSGQILDQQSTSATAGGSQQQGHSPVQARPSISLERSPEPRALTSSPPPISDQPFQQQQPIGVPYIVQQPPFVPQMAVSRDGGSIGGNRNPLDKPYNSNGQRDWSFGLFHCFGSSCRTCLYATFCPCITYGQNMSRLHNLETHGTPHPKGGEVVTEECLIYLGFLHVGE